MNQAQNTEVKWPNFRVIEIKNTLGARVMVPGNPREAIASATKKADAAVHQLSHEFPVWMRDESNRLASIRTELHEKGFSEERLDHLFTCAHDIKGQATTYGYPVAAIVARLLCDLIEKAPDSVKVPLSVIDQHVDTINAIVRQDLKGDGNAQTNNIINGLLILNQTTLKRMTSRAKTAC